jgi:DNA-binding transcriptional ArsR family regulator
MGDALTDEYTRNRIMHLIKDKPESVKELARLLDLDPPTVLRHIVIMKHKGLIEMERIEGTSPLYKAMEVN